MCVSPFLLEFNIRASHTMGIFQWRRGTRPCTSSLWNQILRVCSRWGSNKKNPHLSSYYLACLFVLERIVWSTCFWTCLLWILPTMIKSALKNRMMERHYHNKFTVRPPLVLFGKTATHRKMNLHGVTAKLFSNKNDRCMLTGSMPGGSDVKDFTRVGITNNIIIHNLRLQSGHAYYAVIRGKEQRLLIHIRLLWFIRLEWVTLSRQKVGPR